MKENALIEAAKEMARVVVLAVLPVLMVSFDAVNGSMNLDVKVIIATAILAALRFIDKYLHTSGTAEKGLTQF
jgi:hypothetical protein